MIETSDAGPPQARGASPPHRWAGALVVLLRVLSVLLVLDVLAQAVLAGLFVTGDVALLDVHGANATQVMTSLVLLLVVACALLRWPVRGPVAPLCWALVLSALVVAQIVVGFSRQVAVHIPLGVAIFGVATVFVFWAGRYRHDPIAAARRSRGARRAADGAERAAASDPAAEGTQ